DDLTVGGGERRLTRGDEARRHPEHVAIVGDVLNEDREFIASQPRRGVGGPEGVAQPVADRNEEPVSGGVAQTVVHRLEVVEVHKEDRDRGTAARASGEGVPDAVPEQRLVGEVGQGVVKRLMASSRSTRFWSVTSLKLQTRPTVRPATRCGVEKRSNTRPSRNGSSSLLSRSGCA